MNFFRYLLSFIYGGAVRLRNRLYDRGVFKTVRFKIPVVSVGNLTSGGTGKTPVVDWITKFYLSQGYRVAIVSRGYKRSSKGVVLVSDGVFVRVSSKDAGDEAAMLARRNPQAMVAVAEKRAEAIRFLEAAFPNALPDVIVLDDGFQHRAVHRDLNLLVINAAKPFFTETLLPHGHLREPIEGTQRADVFLLSKVTRYTDLAPLRQGLNPLNKPVAESGIRITGFRSFFSGERIEMKNKSQPYLFTWAFAFSGIGDPQTFMQTLEQGGLIVEHQKHFPDHHAYTAADIDYILSETVRHGINLIITTEKDYHRLKSNTELFTLLRRAPCFYVEIDFEIGEGRDAIEAALKSAVSV